MFCAAPLLLLLLMSVNGNGFGDANNVGPHNHNTICCLPLL
jgi:hypothetical protein